MSEFHARQQQLPRAPPELRPQWLPVVVEAHIGSAAKAGICYRCCELQVELEHPVECGHAVVVSRIDRGGTAADGSQRCTWQLVAARWHLAHRHDIERMFQMVCEHDACCTHVVAHQV